MNRVAEYGSQEYKNGPQATPRTIKKGVHKLTGGAVELKEISEGWTVAGSCGRYDDACFAVHFDVSGARHGRRFHNTPQGMDNAEKYFEMITK
jgi:hypothetical protein